MFGVVHVEGAPPVEGATIVLGAAAPVGGVVYEGAVEGVPEDGPQAEEAWLTSVALVDDDDPVFGGTSGVEKWMRWPAAVQQEPATSTSAPHAWTTGMSGRDFTVFPSPRNVDGTMRRSTR